MINTSVCEAICRGEKAQIDVKRVDVELDEAIDSHY